MPHVSTVELPRKIQREIDQQLIQAFKETSVQDMVQELLTDTERIMLAKRLASIFMLSQGFSYYRIGKTLGISTSTIKRFHQQLLGGAFPALESITKRRAENKAFWQSIEVIFRAGLPPQGRGRWQGIDKLLKNMS